MFIINNDLPLRVHCEHPAIVSKFTETIKPIVKDKNPLIVCIGTDRSTGDSLGPLVGTILKRNNIDVLGTIDDPVHAVNLNEAIKESKDRFVIAVDACLGKDNSSVGYIRLEQGSLKPGTGVGKELPSIGDYNIAGVVNVGGFMEYMTLQNTRLSIVMKMADIIANALISAIKNDEYKEAIESKKEIKYELYM